MTKVDKILLEMDLKCSKSKPMPYNVKIVRFFSIMPISSPIQYYLYGLFFYFRPSLSAFLLRLSQPYLGVGNFQGFIGPKKRRLRGDLLRNVTVTLLPATWSLAVLDIIVPMPLSETIHWYRPWSDLESTEEKYKDPLESRRLKDRSILCQKSIKIHIAYNRVGFISPF